jgi:putative transcriptional regulator
MNFKPPQVKPMKGNILLAEPFLNDPYFKRTVIFLCEHNDDGSFGFVLNNYLELNLDQVIDQMPPHDGRISVGGPVKNSNLYYLHTLGEKIKESVEIIPGIYMGGDFDKLRKLMISGKIERDQVRFFVGYSGWSPRQLENEIQANSWFVTSVPKEVVMNSDSNNLWKEIMRGLGKKGKWISELPDDPSLN